MTHASKSSAEPYPSCSQLDVRPANVSSTRDVLTDLPEDLDLIGGEAELVFMHIRELLFDVVGGKNGKGGLVQ